MREFLENFSVDSFMPEYRRAIIDLYSNQFTDLAEKCWVIPPNFALFGAEILSPNENSPDELAEKFFNLYKSNNYRIFEKLIAYSDESYHFVLKQVLECMRIGFFGVCVPTLTSVFEGVIARKLGINEIRYQQPLERKINTDSYSGVELFTALSVNEFIKVFFKPHSFSDAPPEALNRHWIQHGRVDFISTEEDTIKLLNAVCAASSLVDWQTKLNNACEN